MIRIIQGTYGFRKGNIILPKTVKDAPFSTTKAEEERLVKLGVAEYVTEAEAQAEAVAEVEAETETEATEAPEAETTEEVEAEAEAEELDKEALIARYKELGLRGNPATWNPETILRKIKEAEAELEAVDMPDLSSDDGVVE